MGADVLRVALEYKSTAWAPGEQANKPATAAARIKNAGLREIRSSIFVANSCRSLKGPQHAYGRTFRQFGASSSNRKIAAVNRYNLAARSATNFPQNADDSIKLVFVASRWVTMDDLTA